MLEQRTVLKFGDIADFSNGLNFSLSDYSGDILLIGVSHFGDRLFPDYSILDSIASNVVTEKDLLKSGDLLFVRSNGNKNLVGRCMLIKEPPRKVTYSGFCIRARIRDNELYNPAYFAYHFRTPLFRKTISGASRGANIQNLNQRLLSDYILSVPPREEQDRIVSILSAYDHLIATNQKQITLLEEAAQRIYKEWFVDFRFPGYEETTFDNGIPIEWHYGELGEVAQFRRGKTITKDDAIAGDVPVIAGGLTPAYYHNQSNTSAPVVTVSGSGANAGFTRMYHIRVWASDCSFIDSFSTKSIYFVYCYLKANKQSIDNLQKGSAQPHVYAKDLNQLRTLIPSLDIVESFHELVKPLFDRIATLEKQVLLLTEARERVLPQLI